MTGTGTIAWDRVDLPDPIRASQTLQEGEVTPFWSDNFMALAWRAKKSPVVMLSA